MLNLHMPVIQPYRPYTQKEIQSTIVPEAFLKLGITCASYHVTSASQIIKILNK